MDAYGLLVITALVFYGGISEAQTNKKIIAKAAAALASNDVDDTTSILVNCTTAKGVSGVCVERPYCEYNTYAIDLTIYAPRGFVRLVVTMIMNYIILYVLYFYRYSLHNNIIIFANSEKWLNVSMLNHSVKLRIIKSLLSMSVEI